MCSSWQHSTSSPVNCSRQVDVRQLARQQCPLEEAGRTARYAFFDELKTRHHASAIAVAHHSDDQAETLLLRMLRGQAPPDSLPWRRATRFDIIRPLLGISRQELRTYLTGRQLTFREDSSNTDQTYQRNRIRHELLPLLQTYNPAITERLSATASLLGEDETLLLHCTETAYRQNGPQWHWLERSVTDRTGTAAATTQAATVSHGNSSLFWAISNDLNCATTSCWTGCCCRATLAPA